MRMITIITTRIIPKTFTVPRTKSRIPLFSEDSPDRVVSGGGVLAWPPFTMTCSWLRMRSLYLSSIEASFLINESISDPSALLSLRLLGCDFIDSSFSIMEALLGLFWGIRLAITCVATVTSSVALAFPTRILSIIQESSFLSAAEIPEVPFTSSCISMSFLVLSRISSQFSIRIL